MSAFERHCTVAELSKLWHFHPDSIRSWFEREPGVLVIDRPEKCHKRGYKSLRIPASVAERVYARHCTK